VAKEGFELEILFIELETEQVVANNGNAGCTLILPAIHQ
jgi:hypothetical protein